MGVFCPKCHKDCIVKNGLRNGIQSYKCKSCNRQFIDNRKKYSNELKIVVVKLCEMKIYYRLIAKIFNIKHISLISYWKTTHKSTIYNEKEIVAILDDAKIRVERILKQLENLKNEEDEFNSKKMKVNLSTVQIQGFNSYMQQKYEKIEKEWSIILGCKIKFENLLKLIGSLKRTLWKVKKVLFP